METDCFYCAKDIRLTTLMTPVCELEWSDIYFLRDQRYRGRCVVACKSHVTEVFQLSDEERNGFFSDLAKTAAAVYELYQPDKLNYAIFGDLVSHLHVHLVPKYKNGPEWAAYFRDDARKQFLSDEEFNSDLLKLKEKLMQNKI